MVEIDNTYQIKQRIGQASDAGHDRSDLTRSGIMKKKEFKKRLTGISQVSKCMVKTGNLERVHGMILRNNIEDPVSVLQLRSPWNFIFRAS